MYDWAYGYDCAKDLLRIYEDVKYAKKMFDEAVAYGTYADQEAWRMVHWQMAKEHERGVEWLMGREDGSA